MYISRSMAKTNQLTPEEKEAKLQKRKEHLRQIQKKFGFNLKFYKEVEEERFNQSLYGPIYFHFPASKEPYQNVTSLAMFKRIFQNERRCADVTIDLKCLQTKQRRGRDQNGKVLKIENIRIFCKQCGPKFIMRYFCGAHTNYNLQLVYFDNAHHHEKHGANQNLMHKRLQKQIMTKKRTIYSKNYWIDLFNDIYEKSQTDRLYYLKHPKYHDITRLRKTFTHYKYEALEYNYLGWKYWYHLKFEQFSDKEQLEPSNNPPEENPDFFMIIHPEMKKNYQLYGDVCYINIIDDGLIKKKQSYDPDIKIWETVTFTGLTQENRFGPFAFSWLEVTYHTPYSIALIASKFFNLSNKKPKVIITPSDSFYDKVYQWMKKTQIFTGFHCYDPICELQNIARNIENPEYFTYFYNLVKSINPAQYKQNLQLLFRNVEPSLISRKLLTKFISKAKKMCFALLETDAFVGLTFKYSGNKYMNSYYRWNFIQKFEIDMRALNNQVTCYNNEYDLKEFIYMVTHQISRMFERGINYLENRGRYEWQKYQNIVDCQQFYQVRYMVKEDIYSILLKQYGKVVQLEARPRGLSNQSTPEMQIYDVYDRRLSTLFMVAPQPDYDSQFNLKKIKWRCNCLYSIKSGLPCCHEMKVALLSNSSIFDQIYEYWHNENKNKRAAYWKPRKTRRNTEK